jgi:phospholipid/cholesterol/gamma-HCH transport system substrate-binding protein
MRTNAGAIARVVAFTVVSLAFVFILVTVFGQFRFDSRTSYSAVFSNVSGLKGGNFVRIAGVEVGKVSDLKLQKDGTVHVNFAIDKGLRLTEGTKASVRYENLIGDRYLALEDGPGAPRRLPQNATIPFQGEGATISSVLGETSALTTTLANRDKLIGDVITNLNVVLHTFGNRDKQFSDGLDKLSLLVGALSERKTDITKDVAYINAATGSVADLLTQARQPIKDTVVQTDRVSGQIESDHNYFDDLVRTLPDVYQTLSRQGLYGDYFGFYICDAILKLNGRNGQPVFVKLVSQVTGRCLPKK